MGCDQERTAKNLYDILILGGGYGERLQGKYRPDSYIPKGLVEINKKHSIEYAVEAFSDKFIGRIILETNVEGRDFYKEWINSYKKDVELFVESKSRPDKCLGVLETISIVNGEYNFNRPVLIVAPDNIFLENQDHLFNRGYSSLITILTYDVGDLNSSKKYGVVETKKNRIISCKEKPSEPASTIIRTSAEIWHPKIFNYLNLWNETGNSDMVGQFIEYLIVNSVYVDSERVRGFWSDIGTKEDLRDARRFLHEKGD